MRIALLIPALLFVAACDPVAPPIPPEDLAFTPVLWKENTPAATRGNDRQECEFAAIGASPFMSQDDIQARAASVSTEDRTNFVNRCMSNKGYQVTEGRVCTAQDRARGQFSVGAAIDSLPPLNRVRCFDPAAGGFVI